MAENPVTAVALDGPVDLEPLRERVGWREVRRYPYGVALETPDGLLCYVFGFGAAVQVGRDHLDPALLRTLETVTGRHALHDTVDTWSLVVEPGAPTTRTRVGWDRVVLPAMTPDLVAVTAMLLGQSAALERFESAAEDLVETALRTSTALALTSRTPWNTRGLVRRVGQVNQIRLSMSAQLYILDRPEETWQDPQVAALYDELLGNLELPQRHQAVLSKLQSVEDATRMVIDLWQGRQSHRLEWAVVLLIVFEIGVTLVEHLLAV